MLITATLITATDYRGRVPTASVAVIDIDGVVADVRHRLRHVEPPPRWDRFFAEAGDDPLLSVGADLAHQLALEHAIIWLSGRPESLREVTERWLHRNRLPPGPVLLRPVGDHRPAARLKLQRLYELARTQTIAAMVDDDPAVVRAVRVAGFPIVLADWIPNDRSLRRAQESDGRT